MDNNQKLEYEKLLRRKLDLLLKTGQMLVESAAFKLRKFSSEILRDTSAEPEELRNTAYADFYGWSGHFAYAVMQDGTKVQLSYWENFGTVDLAQVDYVLLPDGTKLPAPENSVA